MKPIPIDEQFELLRAKLETVVSTSAIIVVTSACAGDGKSATAFGLSRSFGSAGYTALLIDAAHASPTLAQDRAPVSLEVIATNSPRSFVRPSADGPYSTISFVTESLRRNASRPALTRALEACRESYQVIIVDAGSILDSNLAMMLAKSADGILLTVREGRGIKAVDRDLVRAIETHELPILGSVTISKAIIREFKANVDRRLSSVATLPTADGSSTRPRSAVV